MNTKPENLDTLTDGASLDALKAGVTAAAPNSGIAADLQDLAARHAWAASLPDGVLLSNGDASTFLTAHGLHVAAATLETWRCRRSDGPEFVRYGRRIVYPVAALRRFLRVQPSVAA